MSIEGNQLNHVRTVWLDTIGRILTDLALIAVVVPLALSWLAPRVRGECATTPDTYAMILGLMFLAYRLARLLCSGLTDDNETWLDRILG